MERILELNLVIFVHLVIEFYIRRDDANGEGNVPLYRVYKVGTIKLYTVESILCDCYFISLDQAQEILKVSGGMCGVLSLLTLRRVGF